ncbi:MAG: DedA family protein [Candidatus Margulisbacteria bacterium]|nr:DedA family protein [Candidatus Margulisiibacteriota bacterium]
MIAQLIEIIIQFVTGTISAVGYFGVFFLMILESACIPIPSEIIMPFSGFLVSAGKLNIFGVTFFAALGNLVGAVITYAIGYWGGRPFVLKYGRYFFIKEKEVHHAEKFFEKWGDFAVFIARNLPIVRTFISLPAGVAEMNFPKFAVYSFIGSIPWCFGLAYLGFLLGSNWLIIRKYGDILDIVVGIGIIIFIGKVIYDYYSDKNGNGKKQTAI